MDDSNLLLLLVLLPGIIIVVTLVLIYFIRRAIRLRFSNRKSYQYSFDREDLALLQDGVRVKVTGGRINFGFNNTDAKTILGIYTGVVTQVRDLVGPRWLAYRGKNISAASFLYLTQYQALWEMTSYFNARTPLEFSAEHRDTGELRRGIQKVVEEQFPRGTEDATSLCAALMGITPEAYLKWQKNNEDWLNGQ